jgi:hypothetical protein
MKLTTLKGQAQADRLIGPLIGVLYPAFFNAAVFFSPEADIFPFARSQAPPPDGTIVAD